MQLDSSVIGSATARHFVLLLTLALGALGLWRAPDAAAQVIMAQGSVTIRDIQVEGVQRIDPETVRSYMLLRPGESVDAPRLDRSLKSLFATGLFADVTLRVQGDTVIVRVVENPIINRIAFEGNRRIEDDALLTETQLRPRVVFTRTKVQAAVKRILDLYRRSGRFAATVEPKVVQLPQNRVDLIFEIDEGAVTNVRRINFVGNKRFSDGTLREAIQTKESRWYRFLSSDDIYDPDRLSFDRELLRKFYLSKGYADFRVVSAVAELTPDREAFFVTFTVEEGERYKFAKIDIVSQLRDLNTEQLMAKLKVKEGEWYDADKVEDSITALTDALGTLGYAFVEIRPRINRDREARTIAVTFEIQEGPRVYVERINIAGNVRTLDKVIRREFRLAEGDAFNTAKLRRSRQRIRNLGFFDKVEVTNVPGNTADRTVINVEVQERSTGELSFGVGFSTQDGPLSDISIRERNLLGRGQDLRAALTIAQRRQQADVSFTEPYFLDRNLAVGFDIFRIIRDFQDESSFDQKNTGFVVRAGYQITENLRQTLRYTIREDEISDVKSTASVFIQQAAGSVLTSAVGQELLYDVRDSRFDPTEGYYLRLNTDFAGLGGDATFLRTRLGGGIYFPFGDEYVLALTGEVGNIRGIGDDVRLIHRFFIGGETVRGFKTSGLGPRDKLTDDALGGNSYYAGSVEFVFPTGLPKELGIRGSIFSDFGSVFDIDQSGSTLLNSKSIRVSVGVGALWRSPFGPVRVSLAQALIKEDFDKTELFRFSFGTRF